MHELTNRQCGTSSPHRAAPGLSHWTHRIRKTKGELESFSAHQWPQTRPTGISPVIASPAPHAEAAGLVPRNVGAAGSLPLSPRAHLPGGTAERLGLRDILTPQRLQAETVRRLGQLSFATVRQGMLSFSHRMSFEFGTSVTRSEAPTPQELFEPDFLNRLPDDMSLLRKPSSTHKFVAPSCVQTWNDARGNSDMRRDAPSYSALSPLPSGRGRK